MPLSWVVIAARNLRVRHVTFQEFACIRTKNLIQSQACHSLCYVCGDVYVYGAPATTIQGQRKVCKHGGPISHTIYFELGGFYLHSGQNLGEGPNAPSPLANLVPTALPSYHHSRHEGSWRRRPPGRIDHKKGQGMVMGITKKLT